MLNRIVLLVVVASLGLAAFVQESVTSYELPGGEVYPEGVAYDAATEMVYVGSSTDGTLYRGSLGADALEPFVQGEESPVGAAYGLALDAQGRLWVAGGSTGKIWVFDTDDGSLLREYTTPEAEATFLNDVTVTPAGDAYITDSLRPVLFRVPASPDGLGELEAWLELSGTPIAYNSGESPLENNNLNGIAVTDNGDYLITVDMNDGILYRIDPETEEVTPIDLGGADLTNGDGVVIDAQTAFIVRIADNEIVMLELSEDFTSGEVVSRYSAEALEWPATAALAGDRLLVVNTQFNRQGEDNPPPELPFRLLSIPVAAIQQGQEQQEGQSPQQQEQQAVVPREQVQYQGGQDIYTQLCASCHGAQGAGTRMTGSSLQEATLDDPQHIIRVLLTGTGGMPAYDYWLSEEQLAAVTAYTLEQWGSGSAEVTVEMVQQVEQQLPGQQVEPQESQQQEGSETEEAQGEQNEGEATDEAQEQQTETTEAGAQTGEAAQQQAGQGWFPQEQADAGLEVYNASCASCHGGNLQGGLAPALEGEPFMQSWSDKTVAELFNFIRTKMPQGNPGSLTPEQYIDVTTYILEQNEFPVGGPPLEPASERLEELVISQENQAEQSGQ